MQYSEFHIKYNYITLIGVFCGIILLTLLIALSLGKNIGFDESFLGFVHLGVGVCVLSLMRYIYFDKENEKRWQIDGRYFAIVSLFLLAHIPFYLALGEKSIAEEWSIYSYYGLVITVVMSLIMKKKDDKYDE